MWFSLIVTFFLTCSWAEGYGQFAVSKANKPQITTSPIAVYENNASLIRSRMKPLFQTSRNYGNRDRSKSYQLSTVDLLIIANILVFSVTEGLPILSWIHPVFSGDPQLLRKLMKIDYAIRFGQSYRLLTALFCHGDLSHLFFNLMSLKQIGPQVIAIIS